jgi:hypothetical protein
MAKFDRNAFIYWLDRVLSEDILPLIVFVACGILFFMYVAPAGAFVLGVIYYAKEILMACFNMLGEVIETFASIFL